MKRVAISTCIGLVASAAGLAAVPVGAGQRARIPAPPLYTSECGSCHVAYPARMLGGASWNAVLSGLGAHFGVDATVDGAELEAIRAFLESAARSRETSRDGKPLLRITETRWFLGEHGDRLWKRHPLSPADCGACHRKAEQGSYAERDIELPAPGEAKRGETR
jgi:hypothetical protein